MIMMQDRKMGYQWYGIAMSRLLCNMEWGLLRIQWESRNGSWSQLENKWAFVSWEGVKNWKCKTADTDHSSLPHFAALTKAGGRPPAGQPTGCHDASDHSVRPAVGRDTDHRPEFVRLDVWSLVMAGACLDLQTGTPATLHLLAHYSVHQPQQPPSFDIQS